MGAAGFEENLETSHRGGLGLNTDPNVAKRGLRVPEGCAKSLWRIGVEDLAPHRDSRKRVEIARQQIASNPRGTHHQQSSRGVRAVTRVLEVQPGSRAKPVDIELPTPYPAVSLQQPTSDAVVFSCSQA